MSTKATIRPQADDAGNGFLMRQGYTIVEAGWDISAPAGGGRFTIRVPVAKNPDGSPIVGPSMEEFVVDNATTMRGRLTYPAATLDKSKATLTVRTRYEDEPAVVPADKWQLRSTRARPFASRRTRRRSSRARSTPSSIRRRTRWSPGSASPRCATVGSFLRNAKRDDAGTANPLAGDVQYVYTACQSQPCRTLHDYRLARIQRGRSRTAGGRRRHQNWIGGSTGIFTNYRFGQAGRTQRQHIARWYPGIPGTVHQSGDARSGHRQDRRPARALHREQHLSRRSSRPIRRTNTGRRTWPSAWSTPKGKDLHQPSPPMCATIFVASMFHGGAFAPDGQGHLPAGRATRSSPTRCCARCWSPWTNG